MTKIRGRVLQSAERIPEVELDLTLNITKRKTAEDRLRESEEKIRQLAEVSPNMIFINKQGRVVYANKKCVDNMGYAKEEFYSSTFNFLSLIAPESAEKLISSFSKHKRGEEVDPCEYVLVTKSGRRMDTIITTKLIDYDGEKAILGLVTDITERKEMEHKLKEERDKLEVVTKNIGAGLTLIGKDYHILWCNDSLKQTFGNDVERRICFERLHNRNRICPECGAKKVFDGAETDVREFSGVDKSGNMIALQIIATPVKDENGEVFAALELAVPITQRKQMETRLREAEKRYRILFDHSPLGVLIVDPETKALIEFNNVAHQQLGYDREEFAKLTIPDIEAKETTEEVNVHVTNMMKEGGGEFETKHRTKNGEIRNVLVTTKTVELEGKPFFYCIFHDITEIRNVQDALMNSESKYRQLVELAQEGVWAFDNNLISVFVNPRMAKMLGYTEGEIMGKSLFEFVDKDDVEQAKGFLLKFKQGINGHFEYAFARKDGIHVYTSIVASNIIDDEGHLVGTLALVADITERKRTEEALRESEERSRAIVANSPIGIATSDAEKHFLTANDAFCKILGYTEDELRKLTFRDITFPEDTRESVTKMKELEAAKISSFTLEKRYLKKDGSVINGKIMVSATRDHAGRPSLFIAELEDISERKKKELELKAERNKLEAITQSIGAGFVVISKDYRIQWANKFIKEYKGNIEGKLCYATLNNLYQACPSCGVKKIFEHGANFDAHEYSSIDIKGNPHWSEIISTPIRDEAGNVVSAIEIAVDITEKKNLQRELSEYSQNLEKIVTERTEQLKQTQAKLVKSERLAAIGELAGMVGHDLRNPLAGMRSALYYLNKHCGTKLTSTEQKMLHLIDDCVDHSDKIVNDLLDYSRELKLEVRETTIRELVSSSLKSLNVPITVQVIDTSGNDPVRVDIAKMNRVFINLMKNAFEAMPEGGKLEINSKILSDEIEIEVRDTGVGMSTETLARIWTPLFTTKAKGMGFGLAICKRVIEAHAGKINVKSEMGKGTTFRIIMPK